MFTDCTTYQRAKKVCDRKEVSNRPGLVDSVLNLPDGQLKYFEGFNLQKKCEINSAHHKICGGGGGG